ncbi:M48 family metallopeptidase [Methanobacterium formicicum]|uniref:YgjP-like metallopeptidase domain-containing protein n=1 Tax=Methanobacterium formicicum TaxID=2162 RepID=A0A0S4FLX2_METFO|nr:M48 family metallopeptidase [Methanobacterium formicicum]CEL24001.1 hypothetical protein MB9_0353 [Methanobacterium formicicum]
MRNKTVLNGLTIEYNVVQRQIKYPRLELKTGNLVLIVPKGYKKPEDLIREHGEWIYEKISLIKESQERAKGKTLNLNRSDDELRAFITSKIDEYSKELDVRPNRVTLRNMKSKWGSCSSKKNMNFNKLLKFLPREMIQYVVFHEMVHLKVKGHGKEFWKIVSRNFRDHNEKEKDLMDYWFLINY